MKTGGKMERKQPPAEMTERTLEDARETVAMLRRRIASRDSSAPLRAAIAEAIARARPESAVELPDTEE